MARLKDFYKSDVAPALMKKFNYKSVMQIPKIDKIIINVSTKAIIFLLTFFVLFIFQIIPLHFFGSTAQLKCAKCFYMDFNKDLRLTSAFGTPLAILPTPFATSLPSNTLRSPSAISSVNSPLLIET